ncbi:hypothetical protein N7471_012715 [Penicillium samsonianum]|uniref:uncharacterized protein n=1 Tax=Penicillium samsonianum TaxID=1882272 RepID=UPI002549929D|nr:uncharacterized protein N7471_012715 [Penicillium samsonianum]KAJ6125398.1 hypothetical protein N7471_012715 [Penicillium samsonianum]
MGLLSYGGAWPITRHYTWHHVLIAKPQRHTPNAAAFVFDRLSIPQIALSSLLILFSSCVPTFPHLSTTMAFCITFGTHEFSSQLEGYEHVRAYCYNCQHWNGHCITRWPFFTICFIVSSCSPEHRLEKELKISNFYFATAIDSPCYSQVQGKRSNVTHAVTPKTYVTGLTSRPIHGLRQVCNMASSPLPGRPQEAGSNNLLCSSRLKHRVDLDTNEFSKMFGYH